MSTKRLRVIVTLILLQFFCGSLFAGKPLVLTAFRSDLDDAWRTYVKANPQAESERTALRKQLRLRAIELFGEIEPGNEPVAAALGGADKWFDFEWYCIAPYLANADKSDLPVLIKPKEVPGDYYSDRIMLIPKEISEFVTLWQTKEPRLKSLLQLRASMVKINADFFTSTSNNYLQEPLTFERQFDLEFYLTNNQEHRDRLFRIAYGELNEIKGGIGYSKQVVGLAPSVQATHPWYEYHCWYYAKAAGSNASLHGEQCARSKPNVTYKQVKAFEEELAKIGMEDFLKRWRQRIKKSVGLERAP